MKTRRMLLFIVFLLNLSGCGFRYHAQVLKGVKRSEADFVEKKDDVEVRVKGLTSFNLVRICPGNRILNKNFKPLLLTVKNSSLSPVLLRERSIDLDFFTVPEIVDLMAMNKYLPILPVLLSTPFIVVGSILGGAYIMEAAGALRNNCVTVFCGGVYFGLGAVVLGCWYIERTVNQFNKDLANDLSCKVISDHRIGSGEKCSVLLFPRDLPQSFTMRLFKVDEQKVLDFNVQLGTK